MIRLTLARHTLQDNESILAYEHGEEVSAEDKLRRLVALERINNPHRSDAYYKGLGDMLFADSKTLADFIVRMPKEIVEDLFLLKGNRIFIKQEHFSEWMDMTTSMIPSWLIAAYLLKSYDVTCILSKSDLLAFANLHLEQFLHSSQIHPFIPELDYLVAENNGLNDLHIHLNGTTETDVVWSYMLSHIDDISSLYANEYGSNASVKRFAEQVMPGFRPDVFHNRLNKAKDLRSRLLSMVFFNARNKKSKEVKSVFELVGDLSGKPLLGSPVVDEIMFSICCMACIIKTQSTKMMNMFHHYMLLKGLIHRFLVMQTTQNSFPQFQMITDNPFRELVEKQYEERFKQLSGTSGKSYVRLIEGRFSPKKTDVDTLALLSMVQDGFEKAKKSTPLLNNAKLRLIAHFIKRPEGASEKMLPIRHNKLRQDLWMRASSLAMLLDNNLKAKDCVVGIDAAASELDAGPEVFAPIFRYMRTKGIKHFTFHAGEDFRHLLSGIRTIYEAIDFLGLQEGDRIGHGTAIGIDPSLWIHRSGPSCILSQGEWLDNLVFVWWLIHKGLLPQLCEKLPAIECEIQEYSYKIYRMYCLPFLLVEAWKIRYYDPCAYLKPQGMREHDSYLPFSERCHIKEKLENVEIMKIQQLYHAKHNCNGKGARFEYDKLMELSVEHLFHADDLMLIQNVMLTLVAQKGIVIEALPTSNLRISYYNTLTEYHLNRWVTQNSIIKPHIVLGTDDPGIFYTNIYNEYSLAYKHLSQHANTTSIVSTTMEQLIKNSNIYSFDKN